MTGLDTTIWERMICSSTFILLNWTIPIIALRSTKFGKAKELGPTILWNHGKIVEKNLRREKV